MWRLLNASPRLYNTLMRRANLALTDNAGAFDKRADVLGDPVPVRPCLNYLSVPCARRRGEQPVAEKKQRRNRDRKQCTEKNPMVKYIVQEMSQTDRQADRQAGGES